MHVHAPLIRNRYHTGQLIRDGARHGHAYVHDAANELTFRIRCVTVIAYGQVYILHSIRIHLQGRQLRDPLGDLEVHRREV